MAANGCQVLSLIRRLKVLWNAKQNCKSQTCSCLKLMALATMVLETWEEMVVLAVAEATKVPVEMVVMTTSDS